MTLRTSLTVRVFFSLMTVLQRSVEEFFNRQTALGSDVGRVGGLVQGVERGANHVVRVARTEALGDDVGHTHHLEDSAHRAASDDARTRLSGCQHDAGCAVLTEHRVVQGAVLQVDVDHVATGLVHGLGHGQGHFTRLALAHANTTVTITDHGEGSEAHDPTALDHLGHAVDLNHLLAQTVVATFVSHLGLKLSHLYSFRFPDAA